MEAEFTALFAECADAPYDSPEERVFYGELVDLLGREAPGFPVRAALEWAAMIAAHDEARLPRQRVSSRCSAHQCDGSGWVEVVTYPEIYGGKVAVTAARSCACRGRHGPHAGR